MVTIDITLYKVLSATNTRTNKHARVHERASVFTAVFDIEHTSTLTALDASGGLSLWYQRKFQKTTTKSMKSTHTHTHPYTTKH